LATNDVLLQIRGLSAGYNSRKVLDSVSLTVGQREILSITGPNQAGKTTLLLCVVGFLRPTEGDIEFDGEPIVGLPTVDILRSGIAIVPERRELFGSLSVRENLEIGTLHCSRREKPDRLAWVLELFPFLNERLKQRAGTLSGGEQQMLSIGRALMSSPRLLILDEPSLGLAAKTVERVVEALKALNEDGIAILIAEQTGHNLDLSEKRILHIAEGRILGSS
jgi:branched-chain amino acid transport system ATP-binding protein